jgi:glycosyltransferase involved in cell wall biosynthesis
MACGVVPVVTEIPPFAAIAGECGRRWPPGDRAACAAALQQAFANEIAAVRSAVTARFARELAWPVVGARTVAAYTQLVAGGAA